MNLAHFASRCVSGSFRKGSLLEMPQMVHKKKRLLQQLVSLQGLAFIPCYRYTVLCIYFIPTHFMHFPVAIYC